MGRSPAQTIKLLFVVSRPAFWPILPVIFFAGAWFSDGTVYYPIQSVLITIALAIPMSLHGYGLNDIYDLASDEKNPRKKVHLHTERDKRTVSLAAHLSGLLVIGSVVTTLSPIPIAIGIGIVAISYAYSVPPIRLRVRPPLDSLANGIGYFLLPAMLGWSLHRPVEKMPMDVYALSIAVIGIHSFASIMDYNADRAAGDRTAATVYGKRGAALFCLIAMTICYLMLPSWYPIVVAVPAAAVLVLPNERLAKIGTYLIYFAFIAVMIAYYYFLLSHLGNPFWSPGVIFTR